MDYRFLGKTGIKVSSICFGTMTFGREADEETSGRLFQRCREAGINFFDTADVYSGGRSEEILGKLIAGGRDALVIASKVYFRTGQDVNAMGASSKHIRAAVEASLKRLRTDYLDLYYLHYFDEKTGVEETLRALDDLVRQGKILHMGASNFAAWQAAKCLGVSARYGWSRFECLQPMYNLVKRQAEVEILPLAQAESLAVFPYSPLGSGLLTGKYGPSRRPESGRLVEDQGYMKRYGEDWMYETAGRFTQFAQEQGYEPAALALAWVQAHPAVTAPIIGARSLEQLEGSLKALDIEMAPDLYRAVAALSPEPPPATDRSEERLGDDWAKR